MWGDIGGELTLFLGGGLKDFVLESSVGFVTSGTSTIPRSGIVASWDGDVICGGSWLGCCTNNGGVSSTK
jgi:hypothetical protein